VPGINYAIGGRAGKEQVYGVQHSGSVHWLMLRYILLLCGCVVIAAVISLVHGAAITCTADNKPYSFVRRPP
jgi:hypothetical protein